METPLDQLYRIFDQVWVLDTELKLGDGNPAVPYCLVAREIRSRVTIRKWWDELEGRPPFDTGPRTLVVTWFGLAEWEFFDALGLPKWQRHLDLYAEYKNRFNCRATIVDQKPNLKKEQKIKRNSLIGACVQFGIKTIGVAVKEEMRALAQRGPGTSAEKQALFSYCETDVDATEQVFLAMLPEIDVPRALLRGREMANMASVGAAGLPIDVSIYTKLVPDGGFDRITLDLITRVDAQFGVFEGTTFRRELFERLLAKLRRPWPRYPDGQLILTDTTFRDMCLRYPDFEALRQLRNALSKMRLKALTVGRDGRNRYNPSPFATKTGRNAPSSSKSVLGPSTWLRGLIKPEEGQAVAMIDYVSEEFAIGAALSGDEAMKAAYESGDPYLEFAKLAGLVPPDATKESHKPQRDISKTCVLGVGFGMEEQTLALRIGKHVLVARSLLQQHREIFSTFWAWSDNQVWNAMLTGVARTCFGWEYHVTPDVNPRSLRNFPLQAAAAEILKLAVSLGVENNVKIIAMLHDAVWLEAASGQIDSDVEKMCRFMAEASAIVLDGFVLRTEATIVRYPDRYMDERGRPFWNLVMSLL